MKMNGIMRVLALVLVCAMMVGTFAGCNTLPDPAQTPTQGGNTAQGDTQDKPVDDKPFNAKDYTEGVTITIATPSNARIESFDENLLTYMVEEALGVNIEFVTYPSGDFYDKINLMMSTGEKLPDIIFKADDKKVAGWAAEGMLLELSKFYNDPNFSPNITAASKESGINIPLYLANADGEIYGLPRWEEAESAQVFKKLWVYKPWLDAMGLDVPKTAEEFYTACEKVTKTDLNGNGKKDEVAIWGGGWTGNYSGWFGGLMSPFVYAYDDQYLFVKDDKVDFAFTTEAYKEGLKYAKRLADIGALPTQVITNNAEAHDAQLFSADPTVFAFWGYGYAGTNDEIAAGYVSIPGLTDEQGNNGYSHYTISKPTSNACITADCKNPEAAFLVADYFCNELVSLCGRFGIQGTHWDFYENLKDVLPDWENYTTDDGEKPFLVFNLNTILDPTSEDQWNSKEPQHHNYRQAGCWIRLAKTTAYGKNNAMKTELQILNAKVRTEAVQACLANKPAQIFDHGPLTADEMDQSADAMSTLMSYVREMYSGFITGEYDIDTYWSKYIAEMEKIGVSELRDMYQEAYDRVH